MSDDTYFLRGRIRELKEQLRNVDSDLVRVTGWYEMARDALTGDGIRAMEQVARQELALVDAIDAMSAVAHDGKCKPHHRAVLIDAITAATKVLERQP